MSMMMRDGSGSGSSSFLVHMNHRACSHNNVGKNTSAVICQTERQYGTAVVAANVHLVGIQDCTESEMTVCDSSSGLLNPVPTRSIFLVVFAVRSNGWARPLRHVAKRKFQLFHYFVFGNMYGCYPIALIIAVSSSGSRRHPRKSAQLLVPCSRDTHGSSVMCEATA